MSHIRSRTESGPAELAAAPRWCRADADRFGSNRARRWYVPSCVRYDGSAVGKVQLGCSGVCLLDPYRLGPGHRAGRAGVAHIDSYLHSLGGKICLIVAPSERACRRTSQDGA
jgi:hypothetical protein